MRKAVPMRRLFASKKFRAGETGVLPKKDVRDLSDHPDNQKLARRAASDEDGDVYSPVDSNRRCTDILFLLLLICCWVAMTGVGLAATGVVPSGPSAWRQARGTRRRSRETCCRGGSP